jgi:DNA-binding GntR family transcriptional regulator
MRRGTNLVDVAAAELERRILDGAYPVGSRLPNEAALCADLGVSRATLREAVARLQVLDVVSREQGRGTFVRREPGVSIVTLLEANLSISEMIASMGLEPGTSELETTCQAAPAEAASALGTSESDSVIVVRRVRTASGHPVVYSEDYMPRGLGLPESPDAYGGSLYELLAGHFGQPVGGALAQIRPETATPEVSDKLHISPGDLLLVLHQTHNLTDGRTILYSVDFVRNDVFTIYVRRTMADSGAPQTEMASFAGFDAH